MEGRRRGEVEIGVRDGWARRWRLRCGLWMCGHCFHGEY